METRKAGNTVEILGVELHDLSRSELLTAMDHGGVFFNPNVDVIMKLREDPEFFEVFHRAEFRVCDSRIVEMGLRFLGRPIKERIPGSDFFGEFCFHHRDNQDVRVFLLGAGPGVAAEAQRKLNERNGRSVIVGAHSPSFGFEKNEAECAEIVELIKASGATVLAVGLGAPKQEKWIMKHKDALPGIRLFMAVGATFDFEAGNVPRAPGLLGDLGLEWLYRLFREPKRLWRRYLIDDPPFVWLVLKQRLGFDVSRGLTRVD